MPPRKAPKRTVIAEEVLSDGESSCEDDDFGELSGDGKLIVSIISRKLDAFKDKLASLTQKLKDKDERIARLEEQVSGLKGSVVKLEERIDDADAYERRDTLLFSGDDIPTVSEGENCGQIVCNVVKEKLKLNFQTDILSVAHRVGKKPVKQGPDRRKIIVKLCRREVKGDITDACRQLKPSNLFVNESLTPVRSTIMYVLRKAKRAYPDKVAGCNSSDGKVFVWVRPPNPCAPLPRNTRMTVNTHQRLVEFCSDILNTELSTLIDVWPH
jgi:hypothetical protein